MKEHALRTADSDAAKRASIVVQRKCGCGGSCGSCGSEEEKKKKKIQRRALGDVTTEVPHAVNSVLGAAGQSLDPDTRATMESRFGHSFANVRVHTDTHAAESAKEINAAAYTSGTHIVFGAGRFAPGTAEGRRLLAHELAHVVQQRSGTALPNGVGPADDAHERAADRAADAVVAQGPAFAPPPVIVPVAERLVRRKREEDESPTPQEEAHRFIVEDSAMPAAGQMRRAEFVEVLDAAICATSREEMARLGRSTDGCPLLDQWRPRIRAMGVRQLEISIRRWIGGDATVHSAREYIPAITVRLAESIRIWGMTGRVTGVPPDLMELLAPGKIRIGVGSLLRGAIGSLFRKSRDGAAAPAANVALDAGAGRPLDPGVASRMGRVFGRDFSDVRVHTDAEAAAAAAQLNARAFTVGNEIAFGHGEFAPGTLTGDALLAHELAHVAQQDGADVVATKNEAVTTALEHDADDAAVHAVVSLWPRLRRFARDLRTNAMPRLKSSLQLQRCDDSPAELQQYLRERDAANGAARGFYDDDRARQLAEAWAGGDTQYILTARRKRILIEEMLDGDVGGSDQKQILNLLERSSGGDLKQMIGPNGVPHKRLLAEFGGWKKELWSFYMRRYPDAYGERDSHRILFADDPLEATAPDPVKLDQTEPNDLGVVQSGDDLPETTNPLRVGTKRTGDPLSKADAVSWVTEAYGKYIDEKQQAFVGEVELIPEGTRSIDRKKDEKKEDEPLPAEYEAFLIHCVDLGKQRPRRIKDDGTKETVAEQRARVEDECRAQESTTAAFFDRDSKQISLRADRETPSTLVHEIMHAFSHERTQELGRFGMEGLTELLTRRVILRHKPRKGEKPLAVGGHYDDAYDAVQELAIAVGEDLLARVHFQGAVTELCNKLGKGKFDAWNNMMEARGTGVQATQILRGPEISSEEKCT